MGEYSSLGGSTYNHVYWLRRDSGVELNCCQLNTLMAAAGKYWLTRTASVVASDIFVSNTAAMELRHTVYITTMNFFQSHA